MVATPLKTDLSDQRDREQVANLANNEQNCFAHPHSPANKIHTHAIVHHEPSDIDGCEYGYGNGNGVW